MAEGDDEVPVNRPGDQVDWERAQKIPVECRAMRVARIWSGVSKPTWAAGLGVSVATVSIYETRQIPKLELRRRAADLAGIPHEFMERGWTAVGQARADDPGIEARLAAVERQLGVRTS